MAINKGEKFRSKLAKIIDDLGYDVIRFRDAYQTKNGDGVAAEFLTVRVIDTDQVSQRYANVTQFFDAGGYNTDNLDLIQILYAAEPGFITPEMDRGKPLIEEGDELYFSGFAHKVTRQKPLPIANVYVFRHVTCTRLRPLS